MELPVDGPTEDNTEDPSLLQLLAESATQLVEQEKSAEETKSPSMKRLSETVDVHISFIDSQENEQMPMEEPSQDI